MMAATAAEVRQSLDLTKSEHKALDGIIRPHLRLEPHGKVKFGLQAEAPDSSYLRLK